MWVPELSINRQSTPAAGGCNCSAVDVQVARLQEENQRLELSIQQRIGEIESRRVSLGCIFTLRQFVTQYWSTATACWLVVYSWVNGLHFGCAHCLQILLNFSIFLFHFYTDNRSAGGVRQPVQPAASDHSGLSVTATTSAARRRWNLPPDAGPGVRICRGRDAGWHGDQRTGYSG